MPDNTVKVDRTTKWGNPFDAREYGPDLALRLFEDTARGIWSPSSVADLDEPTVEMLYESHCRWHKRIGASSVEMARSELRGKHLGCWCEVPSPGAPDRCHAAVLLTIANDGAGAASERVRVPVVRS